MSTTRSPSVRILVLSKDPALSARFAQGPQKDRITLVKDLQALKKALASRAYDGIILDGAKHRLEDVMALNGSLDLSSKFLVAGPIQVLDKINQALLPQEPVSTKGAKTAPPDPNLGDYVETKFERFVRVMSHGSARNLYPMLMKEIERPLIRLALQETKGNQVQASKLLGMNRNTLRKKIIELKISIEGTPKNA